MISRGCVNFRKIFDEWTTGLLIMRAIIPNPASQLETTRAHQMNSFPSRFACKCAHLSPQACCFFSLWFVYSSGPICLCNLVITIVKMLSLSPQEMHYWEK